MIAFVRSRDRALDLGRVEVERDRVDVGEDRRRAAAGDRLGGREERERRADHLVARADLERVEREHERVGAVRDADRLLDAEVLGRLALEALDLGPEDEAAALEGAGERLLQLRDERRVLRLDVNERNRGTSVHRRWSAASGTIEVRRDGDDSERDHVLDVAERVVEALPARAERVAGGREAERPDRASDQREHRVAHERRLEDAGRDRDERARDRREPADEDGPVVPALEPALGALQARRAQVEPAPAALEKRPAAVEADRPADQRADQVAERPGERDREVGVEAAPLGPEDDELVRERAGGERAGVEHHELARRRERRRRSPSARRRPRGRARRGTTSPALTLDERSAAVASRSRRSPPSGTRGCRRAPSRFSGRPHPTRAGPHPPPSTTDDTGQPVTVCDSFVTLTASLWPTSRERYAQRERPRSTSRPLVATRARTTRPAPSRRSSSCRPRRATACPPRGSPAGSFATTASRLRLDLERHARRSATA